jgi:hypothetical protein
MPKSTKAASATAATATDKPRRGRPPGSKNKAKGGAAAKAGKAAKASKGGGAAMMDDLLAFIRKNPNSVFADAKAAMAKAGHELYPISWGRALALLGRVKSKPRGQGKAATANKATGAGGSAAPAFGVTDAGGAPMKRGRGRPRKNPLAAGAAVAADKPRRGRPPGSKNKPKIGAGAVAGAPATVRRGPRRPRKNPIGASSTAPRAAGRSSSSSIQIADADVMSVQGFVDAVNRGAKVELRYSGDGWALAAG